MSTQASASSADMQVGEAIAKKGAGAAIACMQCHGENGEGRTAAGFPRLAGQNQNYLVKQMTDYKIKLRSDSMMEPIAKAMTTVQINNVANYYAALPTGKPNISLPQDAAQTIRGTQLTQRGKWDEGVPACFACHGENGAGTPPHFPGIARQGAIYTAKQLKSWQAGTRSNDPQGLMKAVAIKLSADDIRAVSAYLETPK
jgi:cytochrome c553